MTTENLQKPLAQLSQQQLQTQNDEDDDQQRIQRSPPSTSDPNKDDDAMRVENDNTLTKSRKTLYLSTVNNLLHEEISRRCHQLEERGEEKELETSDKTTSSEEAQLNSRRRSKTSRIPKKKRTKTTFLYHIPSSAALSLSESRILAEATAASSSCFVDESQLPVVGQIGSLVEAFNAYSHYVRRIVGYCNRVEAFKALKRADQLLLVKPFYFELLAIRFSFIYNVETDSYPVMENEAGTKAVLMRIGLINDCRQYHVTAIHRKYKSCLHEAMEGDPTIRDLIMIQFLFRNSSSSSSTTASFSENASSAPSSSSTSVISCLEFVRKQYFLYCHLLRRYLEVKFNGNAALAAKKYASLMELLDDFSRYHYVREIFDSIEDPSAVSSDVLSEIFNR